MRNFPLQKKLILGGLTILLLADVAFAYYSMKLSSPQQNRQGRLAAEMRQRDLVKADIKRATEIRQKIPLVLKQLDEFEGGLLPSTKGYSVVTHELDEHARDSHVSLEDVRFHEKEVTGRNLSELTMDMAINGGYTGIVEFLNHLQRSKIAYIIDALEVDSLNAGQAPAGTLRVTLHLRTYFRKV